MNRSKPHDTGAREQAPTAEVRRLRSRIEELEARVGLLHSTLNALPAWISVKDVSGRYLLVKEAHSLGAYPAEHLGERTLPTLDLAPGEQERFATLDAQVISTGVPVEDRRFVFRLRNGEQHERYVAKWPLRDADGAVTGVVSWSEHHTSRMQAAQDLEENRNLLQAVIDVVPHPISYIDGDLVLRQVNPAWCALFDCDAAQVVGKTILNWDPLPLPTRQRLYKDNLRIVRTGVVPAPQEYEIPTARGETLNMVIWKSRVVDANRLFRGIVTVAVDVTSLKRAEESARRARQHLIDAVESMPAGIQLYDAQERLEYSNQIVSQFFPAMQALWKRPGATVQAVLEASLSEIELTPAERKTRLQKRLAEFRDPPESIEFRLKDGRTVLGRDRRLSNGGTISVRMDVTELKRVQAELERREREIRGDLALAAELQRSILRQPQAPPHVQLAHRFQPSALVSGDLFSARVDPSGALHLFMGDATGHSVAAGLQTMLVQASLNGLPVDVEPGAALEQLNRELLDYQLDDRFVTGAYLTLARDGTCIVAHAGHPPAILLPRGGPARSLRGGGFALGWFDALEVEPETLHLTQGDTLLLFTDGLTEWSDQSGSQFGYEGVLAAAERLRPLAPEQMAGAMLDAAAAHGAGTSSMDDITLFVLRYVGTSTPA